MSEMTLGKRIMHNRKRLGLTQEQLAERMGVSAQAVSKWENDQSCPDITLLPKLAEIFEISVDELLGREAAHSAVKTAEPVEKSGGREMHFNMEWRPKEGIWFAVYILCIGGLLLLTALRPELNVSWWTILWTTALLIGGLAGMVHQPSFFPLAVMLAGAYFLVTSFGVWKVSLGWKVVIPAFLLLWGLSLLIDVLFGKKRKHPSVHAEGGRCDYSTTDGWLKVDAQFDEHTLPLALAELRGGEIQTCFGSYRIDFSECRSIAPGCCLSADCKFGETVLLMPRRFRVEIDPAEKSAFAADVKEVGRPDESPEGTILLRPKVRFGELRIEYLD